MVDTHFEALLEKLRNTKRAMIVGPHGTGKSTLLHSFLPKLQRGYPKVAFQALNNDPSLSLKARFAERYRAGKRIRHELNELPSGGLLIVDGWEQLGRATRWRTTKRAASRKVTLLVTAHHRTPGWSVLHETQLTSKLIRALANDLLKDHPYELRKMIDSNLKRRKLLPSTNIRELWFELYDLVENDRSSEFKFNV